jgi:peptide/nickel transport system substrate-binding protein
MVANPHYHRGAPKLERFQLYVYSTRDDIEQALSTSEIMATPELRFDARSDKIKTMYASESHAINNGVYALFNTNSELLREKDIRQALSLSVDRDKLIQSLSQSATSLDGPVLDRHTPDLPRAPQQDVKKAQELLDQAGWRVNGTVRAKDGAELSLRMVALQGAGSTQTATELAKLWQETLNIKVDVQMVDPLDSNQNVLQTVLQPRNFDILIYELVLGGDPDSYAYWHSSQATPEGLNFSNYSSVVVDDALAGARVRTDAKYRDERYRVFARRWLADIPAVALYQPKIDYIHSRSTRTVDEKSVLVSAEDRYYNVIYWSIGTASVYKTP